MLAISTAVEEQQLKAFSNERTLRDSGNVHLQLEHVTRDCIGL